VGLSPSVTPLLTPAALAPLRELGVRSVSVSLDGARAATHEGIRGVDRHFRATIDALRMLVDEGFTLQVDTTVMVDNVEELADVAGSPSRRPRPRGRRLAGWHHPAAVLSVSAVDGARSTSSGTTSARIVSISAAAAADEERACSADGVQAGPGAAHLDRAGSAVSSSVPSSTRRSARQAARRSRVNLILAPDLTIGFCKASMISPDGRCHAFDAGANGYVRSEGAGIVVLKALDRARADRDRIHAVIRSTAINEDGRTAGISLPNADAQARLLERALEGAGVDPATISYVEAHGTGTEVGDPAEAEALGRIIGRTRAPGNEPDEGSRVWWSGVRAGSPLPSGTNVQQTYPSASTEPTRA
jgi:hypothetical protein